MYNTNILPKIKIELYASGKFYVMMQTRKKSFFKKEKWVHIIFYTGTNDPFGFSTYDNAMEALLHIVKQQISNNS